ncbi:MAG: glycosyltransferase [Candidatus Algichlamydia australiensis]|nr:glycosyltransferase [Chlamydiales bacterium]
MIFLLFILLFGAQDFYSLMGEKSSRWSFVNCAEDRQQLERYASLYDRNAALQFEKNEKEKIPSDLHLIWLGPRPFPSESVENIRMWRSAHPNWTFHFWTDRARPAPIQGMVLHQADDFPFQELGDYYKESSNWGQKSDLLRYEILQQRGGIYIDHDANCLRSFDGLRKGYDFFACLEMPHARVAGYSVTAGIGILGAVQEHPVISGAIEEVKTHWEESKNLFPQTSPKSVREYVMHSTYMATTRSMQKHLDQPGFTDIILPACYFYPQKGFKPLYSFHYYGTSWAGIEKRGTFEKEIKKSLRNSVKLKNWLYLLLALAIPLSFFRRRQCS